MEHHHQSSSSSSSPEEQQHKNDKEGDQAHPTEEAYEQVCLGADRLGGSFDQHFEAVGFSLVEEDELGVEESHLVLDMLKVVGLV